MSARSACSTAPPITTSTMTTLAEDGDQRFATTGGWLGFSDKYWLTALIPDQRASVDASYRRGRQRRLPGRRRPPRPTIVAPGKAATTTSHFFAGAKEIALLDDYEDQLGIAQFDKAIDWGWFCWFMKPIFYAARLAVPRRSAISASRSSCLTVIVRGADVPDRAEAVQVDGGDARRPAEDEGAAGALQGRQAEAAAGDDEAVQGGEGQPAGGLPADPAPDPDLLRALQGADAGGRNAPPAVRRCGSRICRRPIR